VLIFKSIYFYGPPQELGFFFCFFFFGSTELFYFFIFIYLFIFLHLLTRAYIVWGITSPAPRPLPLSLTPPQFQAEKCLFCPFLQFC
jgi:hypothetical protein